MVAINYAKDIRVGEHTVKAAALGGKFVWPPLPERLFLRGQSLVYDFANQRYGVRLPDNTIDYTSNVNDLGIVTRASTATYWGPEGSLLEAAVDEARIQHDPVTGKALGLLIEREATNTVLNTEDPSGWGTQSGATVTVESGDGPDRVYRVTDGTGAGRHGINIPTQEGTNYTRFFDFKPGNWGSCFVSVESTGTRNQVLFITGGGFRIRDLDGREVTAASVDLGDGWFRYSWRADAAVGSFWIGFTTSENSTAQNQSYQGSADRHFFIRFPQAHTDKLPGEAPTSYIPTAGAAATRAADNAVIYLSDVFNPDEGTLRITAQVPEGEVVASLGDIQVVSDSDEKKSYRMTYSDYAGVPTVSLGNGIHSKLEYFPEAQS